MNLAEFSRKALSDLPIKDLVQSKVINGRVLPEVKFFQLSSKAKAMISDLHKLCKSKLLQKFWIQSGEKEVSTLAKERKLDVDEIERFVWTPSITQLRSLKDRFLDGTISFKEIDSFSKVFANSQEMAKEFKLITSRASESTVDERINQVNEYNKLETCIDAAGSVLKFKECLDLRGDFLLVEDLHNQVCLL